MLRLFLLKITYYQPIIIHIRGKLGDCTDTRLKELLSSKEACKKYIIIVRGIDINKQMVVEMSKETDANGNIVFNLSQDK